MMHEVLVVIILAWVVTVTACGQSDDGADADAASEASPGDSGATVVPYTARGNEPGWTLTVLPDRLELVRNYGQSKVSTPRPEEVAIDDGYYYKTATETDDLRVDVVNKLCHDNMSGMPYPDTVTVAINGETLNGCGGQPAALLTGDEWIVEDLDNKGIVDSSRATMLFDNGGGLSGRATCNQYSSQYELTGEGLAVGNIAATRMACPPALMDQEARFLSILGATQRFDIAGDGALVVIATTGETITARR